MYNNENENNEMNINNEAVENESVETEAVEAEDMSCEADSTEVEAEAVEEVKVRKPMSNHAKFRTVSGVMTALVIVAVIIVNLLVGAIGNKVNTKIDLTAGKILDLADETIDTVKGLEKEVNVYSLIPEGSEDEVLKAIDEILVRYQQLSNKITYRKIDTVSNPEFLQKYSANGAQINVYSVIFESSDKFKVVDVNDIVSVNQQTGQIQSLSAEQKFTSALMYVANDALVKVGIVQGHNEITFSEYDSVVLEPENYDAVEVNLITGSIPEDVNTLIIPAPQRDFTPDEINALDSFFDRGGKVQLIMDFVAEPLPTLEAYLAEWGVTMYNGFVVEQDSNKFVNQPTLVVPEILSTDMTDAILERNLSMVYPQARAMKVDTVSGVEKTDLVVSSETSFVRTNFEATELEMVEGDIAGPAVIATMLSRYHENGTGKLMIMGGTGIFQAFSLTAYANKDFYYNTMADMTDSKESIYIRPKDVSPNVLAITAQQALILAGITVIVLPLLILIAGFVVWFKRRHL